MLFLVIGDPTAAWVGTFYGKHRFSNGKSVEGIVAFIVVCSVVGFVFMYLSETSDKRNFLKKEDFVFYNSLIFLISFRFDFRGYGTLLRYVLERSRRRQPFDSIRFLYSVGFYRLVDFGSGSFRNFPESEGVVLQDLI